MKSKQYTDKPVALRFRRWSRKGYAAFVSIQRAVTIGRLTANVCERFEVKNCSTHASLLGANPAETAEAGGTEEEESGCLVGWPETTLTLWQCPAQLLIQTIQQPAASTYAYTLIYNSSEKAEGFSIQLRPSAFSVYTNSARYD